MKLVFNISYHMCWCRPMHYHMLDKPRRCLDDDLCMWEWVWRNKDVIFKIFLSSLSFSLKNMEPLSLGFNFVALHSKWQERHVFIVPKWNYVVLEEIEKLWAFSRYSRQCSNSRFEHSDDQTISKPFV